MTKYVKIVWRDIAGVTSANNEAAWFAKKEALEVAKELYDQEYYTVGEILEDNDEFIVIAATTDNDEEKQLYSDISMIPKSVIIRIENL